MKKEKKLIKDKKIYEKRREKKEKQKTAYKEKLYSYLEADLETIEKIYKYAIKYIEENYGTKDKDYSKAGKMLDEFYFEKTKEEKKSKKYKNICSNYIGELKKAINKFEDSYKKIKNGIKEKSLNRTEEYEELKNNLRENYYAVGLWAYDIIYRIYRECTDIDIDNKLFEIQKNHKGKYGEYCREWDKKIGRKTFKSKVAQVKLFFCHIKSWALQVDYNYFKILIYMTVFMLFFGILSKDYLTILTAVGVLVIALWIFIKHRKDVYVDKSISFIESRKNGLIKFYWFDKGMIFFIMGLFSVYKIVNNIFKLSAIINPLISKLLK